MAETPAAQCGGCAAPLSWAALGRGVLIFETAETRDLCGRCTLDFYYRTGGLGAAGGRSTGHATTFPFPFAAAAAASRAEEESAAAEKKKGPSRCAACLKKVGLLGFACRCSSTFCAAHRHAESHSCGFHHRGVARKRIASENPTVVVAPKVTETLTHVTGQ